ncbi:hypothetical protein OH77DRAFT_1594441 [Trametes cingulata]|nr:hypothetical protein OH77DRAFT_1594441 [Trametes cingulata]
MFGSPDTTHLRRISRPPPMRTRACTVLVNRSLQISANCERRLCAPCCRELPDACGFASHNKARSAQQAAHASAAQTRKAVQDTPAGSRRRPSRKKPGPEQSSQLEPEDPFALHRPPPVRPPVDPPHATVLLSTAQPHTAMALAASHAEPIQQSITSSTEPPNSLEASVPPQRIFRTVMQPAWRALWDQDEAARRSRQQAQQQRRENEIALAHSAVIWWWQENGRPPMRLRVHTKTFPTLNLQQMPDALTAMSLQNSDPVDVYDLGSMYWERRLAATAFDLKLTGSVLLLRHVGVTECPEIDRCIADAHGTLSPANVVRNARAQPTTRAITTSDPRECLVRH